MSKDIIDVDQFTSPVHVPEGLDSRDHAAEDVEAIAQALANRTLSLKNRADALEAGVAYRAQDNAFIAHNSFTQPLDCVGPDPGVAIITAPAEPAALGSAWRLIERHKYAGGLYLHSYTGSNTSDTNGAYVICTNAFWDAPSARWAQMNATQDSVALIWHRGRVRVCRAAAGAAPWANWSTGFVAGKSAVAPGAVMDALVEGEYRYLTTRSRSFPLDLANAYGPVKRNADGSIQIVDPSGTGTTIGTVGVPLRVANNTQIESIDVLVNIVFQPSADPQSNLTPPSIALLGRSEPVWNASPPTPPTAVAIATAAAPFDSLDNVTIRLNGPFTLYGNTEYQVTYTAQAADKLLAIRVNNWGDTGPRNAYAGA